MSVTDAAGSPVAPLSATPAEVVLYCLDASIEQAAAKVERRSRDPRSVYAYSIGREGNEHLASIMEPPSETEGFDICLDPSAAKR